MAGHAKKRCQKPRRHSAVRGCTAPSSRLTLTIRQIQEQILSITQSQLQFQAQVQSQLQAQSQAQLQFQLQVQEQLQQQAQSQLQAQQQFEAQTQAQAQFALQAQHQWNLQTQAAIQSQSEKIILNVGSMPPPPPWGEEVPT
jgi:gamma-glutamylcysteine synthetase